MSSTTTSSTTTPTTTTTTTALSPLASRVGKAVSAQPVPPLVDVAPTAISIGAISVDVPVRSVGIAPDGQLEVPDETHVGWYRHGAAPGQPGATVLAAHVSWHDRAGPFLRLGELEPGAFVDLALEDGSSRRYQVVSRAQHGKLMLPREEIWRTTGPETLVLITCGGAFNPDIRRYTDNIVITAAPVGS
jgi:sortase (surface protein transpeptidase)